jgi:hypothetical protein
MLKPEKNGYGKNIEVDDFVTVRKSISCAKVIAVEGDVITMRELRHNTVVRAPLSDVRLYRTTWLGKVRAYMKSVDPDFDVMLPDHIVLSRFERMSR